MPCYTYETMPEGSGKPKVYEIEQRMADDPLTRHPETGERIRRIITADRGVITGSSAPECGSDCGVPGSGGGCGGCCPLG